MGFIEKKFNGLNGVMTLGRLANLASSDKYPRLSKEQEMGCVKAWQNDRDENALKRLLIDKSRLILVKAEKYVKTLGMISSPEDIHADALYGAIRGIEKYPVDEAICGLNTYIVNGAQWHVQGEFKAYMGTNTTDQNKGREALNDAENRAQRALTTKEEQDILGGISPALRDSFHKRRLGNTILASDLPHDSDAEHPSRDGACAYQHTPDEAMDWAIDPDAKGPYEYMERRDLVNATNDALESLNERERKVIEMRFCVGKDQALHDRTSADKYYMSLAQIGNALGVTKERVRQIEICAIRKLQHNRKSPVLEELYGDNHSSAKGYGLYSLD